MACSPMSRQTSANVDLAAGTRKAVVSRRIRKPGHARKTVHLVLFPLMISLLPILLLARIDHAGYHDTPIQSILSGAAFFLWGCTGVPIITRREIPWLPAAPGWAAVLQGTIFLMIGWGIAMGFAILTVSSLL